MIDNHRKKHNNSASLGRTLARTQQHHFSYFAQPREFEIDLQSIKEGKQSNKKMIKKQLISTPKISPQKTILSNPSVVQSYIKLQVNKQKCSKLGMDVHTATMDKNLKINKMYQQLHHFSICVDELKWLLKEGYNLISTYLSQVKLISPTSIHTMDVTHISEQFRTLQLRFASIQKNRMQNIGEYIKKDRIQKREYEISNQFYVFQPKNTEANQIQSTFPYTASYKQRNKESNNKLGFQSSNNYSMQLKQNVNTSNLPNFDNIVVKSHSTKTKPLNNKIQFSVIEENRQKDQILIKEREQSSNKLKIELKKNQDLMVSNESLREQIDNLQTKLSKYKAASFKSIEQLSQLLRQLSGPQNDKERDLSLLKLAQSIKNWQTIIEDQAQQKKYREIYGDPSTMQLQKAKNLQEIIELQYQINTLLGQKQNLSKNRMVKASQEFDEDLLRILAVQACTLQELYKL